MPEVLCKKHMNPGCRMKECREPNPNEDPHITILSAPMPPQVSTAPAEPVPNSGSVVPVPSTPAPVFSSPQAAKAMELAQAYESVSRCQQQVDILVKGLSEARTELAKAISERDKIQAELMPVHKTEETSKSI